jgi:outer membrane protein TolC
MAAARSAWQAANSQQAETAGDLTYRVKRAYLEAQYARRLYDVAVSGLEQARQQLRQVTLYQQAGTRAEYDLLRAQVDAANQEPVVVATRNSYDIALLELKRLANVPADRPIALVTPMVDRDGMIPVLAETEVDVVDRPALAAAEATVRVRQQLLRVAKADRWPSVSVQSTFSEQAFPSQVLPFDTKFRRSWNAALKVSVPIFNGFRTEGAVEQARADVDRAMAERDQVAENVRLDVAQARAELERTRALAAARQETVRQAKRAQYLANVRYTNGLSTQLEVSDARLLAQQAEVNEVQATRDYLVALAQLERALGRPVAVVRQPLQQAAAGTTTGEGSSNE